MPMKRDPESQRQLLEISDPSIATTKSSASMVFKSVDDAPSGGICGTIQKYPKGVFFMLGNEFCERFSFYGMRAVLTLYFVTIHNFPESTAKLLFHLFVSICYLTPLVGSILADGYFGRFKVILYGSMIYCLGHVMLTTGAIPGLGEIALKVLDFSGLLVIAIATGGIKPCVSAFAADQFPPDQAQERESFFSFFYFAINAGALLSKIITPILRGRVSCMGEETCFPLAFGIPAILMFVALVLFILGKPFYVFRQNTEENIVAKVCRLIIHAISKRLKGGKTPEKSHWLDYANDKFDGQLIDDVKRILSILVLFIPVVLFWALFDQQGSTWVLQANRMNGNIGYLTILPDQMSVFNPFLVIILVPLMTGVIYPLLNKYNILTEPLKRMGAGGVLAGLAFVIAGFLQLYINRSMVHLPPDRHSRFFITNALPNCVIHVEADGREQHALVRPGLHLKLELESFPKFNLDGECGYKLSQSANFTDSKIDPGIGYFVSIASKGGQNAELIIHQFDLKKTKNGDSKFIFHIPENLRNAGNSSIVFSQKGDPKSRIPVSGAVTTATFQPTLFGSKQYDISVESASPTKGVQRHIIENSFTVGMGPVYGVSINSENQNTDIMTLVQPNTVCLLWQIPQYVVITTGEILLSVTGLEFSYSQAPPSMKSVLQAFWLLTVAFGNFLDMIISGSNMIHAPHTELFVYAALMGAVMVLFAFLAKNYTYADEETVEATAVMAKTEKLSSNSIRTPISPVELRPVSEGEKMSKKL